MQTLDEKWRAWDREARRLGEEHAEREQAEQRERERVQAALLARSIQRCTQVKPEHDAGLRRMAKAAGELQAAIEKYRGFLQALAEDGVSIGDRLPIVHVDAALDGPLSWLLEQIEAATK